MNTSKPTKIIVIVAILCAGFFVLELNRKNSLPDSNSFPEKINTIATSTPPVTKPISNEVRLKAYTTAYTYWDNTPPGSSLISHPILHTEAGGTGTYTDPITVAVGHSMTAGKDTLDYPAGTKFYIPNVRKYFIVEDSCGDGDTPQNVPCHNLSTAPKGAQVWLDLWIDGASGTKESADTCASKITDSNGTLHLVIKNPLPTYIVATGPVFKNGKCAEVFGDAI